MAVETLIYSALRGLVNNKVYRDVAKKGITNADLPWITFQQVGGSAVNFLDSSTRPSKKNARVQVNVWGSRRDEVMALARQVEDTLRGVAALHATVLGAPMAVYEPETERFGSIQDFSLWFED